MSHSTVKESSANSGSQPLAVVVNGLYEVKITNLVSLTNFGIQLRKNEATDHKIQDCCQKEGPNAPRLKNLVSGNLCLAKFQDDNWYRAFIREVDEPAGVANVYFIDYGNSDDCDLADIRECPASVIKILPQVIECQWEGASSSLTSSEKKKILGKINTFLEEETYVQAKVVEIVANSGWLFNIDGGQGPVILRIPILDCLLEKGTISREAGVGQAGIGVLQQDAAVVVGGYDAIDGDVSVKKELQSGAVSIGQHKESMANANGPFKIETESASPHPSLTVSENILLNALTDLEKEIGLIKEQIYEMAGKNAGPKIKMMTPEEASARILECKTESAECDEKINALLKRLSQKDDEIKMAASNFAEDAKKIEALIAAKDEELAAIRNHTKLRYLNLK